MKKVMLTVLAAAVLLCSCGEQPKDVDIDALAQQIVEGVSFDDALAEIDDSMISMLYNIEGYTDAVLYKGSGCDGGRGCNLPDGQQRRRENRA